MLVATNGTGRMYPKLIATGPYVARLRYGAANFRLQLSVQ